MTKKEIKKRLEEIRKSIQNENISYGEIAELQGLKEHIEEGDIELLQVAEGEKTKCDLCEEEVEEGEGFGTIDGRLACEGCYQSEWEHPSTVIIFNPDGSNESIQFTQNFGTPEGDKIPEPIEKEIWKNTDGWRGYTDWELKEGFIEVADGWITGFPDRTTERKIELAEIFDKLKAGEIKPPCKIYWIFGITSNVFSTASSVVIENGNEEIIEKWLQKIDGGTEGLKEMLS